MQNPEAGYARPCVRITHYREPSRSHHTGNAEGRTALNSEDEITNDTWIKTGSVTAILTMGRMGRMGRMADAHTRHGTP